MGTQDIMRIINKLSARRDRQNAQLEITKTELAHWEAEILRLTKGK